METFPVRIVVVEATTNPWGETGSAAVQQLRQLGFSQYEAQAYISLLEHNPANGYELAKASKIPRANIYTILQRLEERGMVLREDGKGAARYSPIPPQELIERTRTRMEGSLESARQSLASLYSPGEPERVWSICGYTACFMLAS